MTDFYVLVKGTLASGTTLHKDIKVHGATEDWAKDFALSMFTAAYPESKDLSVVRVVSAACLTTGSNTETISLSKDGDQWCALLGENLQEGIAGFGTTRSAAVMKLGVAMRYAEQQKAYNVETNRNTG